MSGETAILTTEVLLIEREGRKNKKGELVEVIGECPFL